MMDQPGSYTFETLGSQRVVATTTGKEKVRISCIFSARAAGRKLPILMVIPRNTALVNVILPSNCIPVYLSSGN